MKGVVHNSYQPAFSWITICASLLFAVILGFSRLSYGLFLPGIQREMGGSYGELGRLGTLNFTGYLAGTLFLPLLIGRFPSKKHTINKVSCTFLGIAMIGSAFSHSFIQLGLWRFVIGLLSAFATVLVLSIALDSVQPNQRGRASGLIWLGGSAGIMITGLLAPYTIDPLHMDGWRYAWAAMGIFGICSSLGFEAVIRRVKIETPVGQNESNTRNKEHGNVYQFLFSPTKLLFLIGSYFFFGWGYIIYFTYLIPFLVNQGIPSLYAGLIWCGIGFAGLFNGWLGGRAIDRWPSGFTLATGLTLGTIGVLGVLTNSIILTSLGGALIGLVSFITPPLMTTALLRRNVPNGRYATCLSITTAFFATGQIIGPLFGGEIVDRFGLQFGVTSSSIFMAISAVLACIYGGIQQKLETQNSLRSK